MFAAARSPSPKVRQQGRVREPKRTSIEAKPRFPSEKDDSCGIRPTQSEQTRSEPLRTEASRMGAPMISVNNVSASWHSSGCSLTTEADGQLKPRMMISSLMSGLLMPQR